MTLDYLAGLFDGEGTVGLYRLHSTSLYRSPYMELTSTTEALVLAMKETFGGCISQKIAKREEHHKDSWIWSAKGDAVLVACEALVDRILEPKKIARMRLLLSDYKRLTLRNGRYNAEQAGAKHDFENRFFAL